MIKRDLNLNYEKTTTILDRFRSMLGGFRFKMINGKGHYKGPGMSEFEPFCDGSGGGGGGYYDNMDYPDLEDDPLYRKSGKHVLGTPKPNFRFIMDRKAVLVLHTGVNSYRNPTVTYYLDNEQVLPVSDFTLPNVSGYNSPPTVAIILTDVKEDSRFEMRLNGKLDHENNLGYLHFFECEYEADISTHKPELLAKDVEEYTLDDDYKVIFCMNLVKATTPTTIGSAYELDILCNNLYKGFIHDDLQWTSFSISGYSYTYAIYRTYMDCKSGDTITARYAAGRTPQTSLVIVGIK